MRSAPRATLGYLDSGWCVGACDSASQMLGSPVDAISVLSRSNVGLPRRWHGYVGADCVVSTDTRLGAHVLRKVVVDLQLTMAAIHTNQPAPLIFSLRNEWKLEILTVHKGQFLGFEITDHK